MGGIGASFRVCGVSSSMGGIGDIFRVRCVIFNGWHRRHLSYAVYRVQWVASASQLSFFIPVSGLTPLSFCDRGHFENGLKVTRSHPISD
jgi:hypothetical protein